MSGLTQPVSGPQSSAGSGRAPSLRPYQHESVASALHELYTVGRRSTLLVKATGTGKTVTFAEIARIHVSRGERVLILVNRDELVRQAKKKCEDIGLWPDVEKAKLRASVTAKVVLASVQTFRSARLQRWARDHFKLIIVDEAHHAAATSYQTILSHFESAKVLGVTATPKRADGKALGDTFESVAYTYDIRRAIDEKYLVPIVARRIIVESVDLRTIDTRAGDFAQDQLAEAMADERALRGVVVPALEQARDRLTIVFCVNVKHAHELAKVFNAYRPGCARAVSGDTDDREREQLLADHAAGRFQFLCNCDLLVEGYDAPPVSCVIMARPTKSWARFVQCAGRGLRPSPDTGKRDCLILDCSGTAGKHALIGPADCLRGADEEVADDVRAEIDRQLETAQLDIASIMALAQREVEQRRASMRLQAVVYWHAQKIDPFIGRDDKPENMPHRPEWREQSASKAQLDALLEEGVNLDKMPPLTRAEAWDLLVRIKGRRKAGLCSYKAAKRLASLGVKNTATLTHKRAQELIAKCLELGWHPNTLRDEPECQEPAQRPLLEDAQRAQSSFLSEEDFA